MVYLFAAYTIIWLGVTLYVFGIGKQQQKLQSELAALEAAVGQSGRPAGGASVGRGSSKERAGGA